MLPVPRQELREGVAAELRAYGGDGTVKMIAGVHEVVHGAGIDHTTLFEQPDDGTIPSTKYDLPCPSVCRFLWCEDSSVDDRISVDDGEIVPARKLDGRQHAFPETKYSDDGNPSPACSMRRPVV